MSYVALHRELENELDDIKGWLKHQAHLPQNIDDQILRRFIMSCGRSLERTKHIIDLNYTIRSQAPEIFANRDPLDPTLKRLLTMGEMIPLPKTTGQNYKCLLFRVRHRNTDNFVFGDILKTILMIADVRLVTEQEIPDGEVPIFDMTNINLYHLAKVNLQTLRKYMMYTQEAHPVRLRQIHLINIPTFLDKVLMIVRPFLKSEVSAMIKFHTNVESLYSHVPREILPDEYGGQAGKLEELKAAWLKKLDEHRDYFLDATRWHVDEGRRAVKAKKPIFGTHGSFKTLCID